MIKETDKNTRPPLEEVLADLASGELIERYRPMVHKVAHGMKRTHPIEDFDELVAEGYFGLVGYMPKYNPTLAAINTWAYKCIWGSMKNFCLSTKRNRDVPMSRMSEDFDVEAPSQYSTMGIMKELSEDAGLLLSAAFEAPEELSDVIRVTAPKQSAKALRKYMKKVLGWEVTRIDEAWSEVQSCL